MTRIHPLPDVDAFAAVRALIATELAGAHEDVHRFFAAVFSVPVPRSARALARILATHEVSLNSRFMRAGLPSPKRYLDWAMMLRAAGILERHPKPIHRAAFDCDFYAPQHFSRFVLRVTGQNAAPYFATHTSADVLAHLRDTLILPHRETLLAFHPLQVGAVVTRGRVAA